MSVRAGAAGVVFRPNVSIGLMQFGSGGKRTVGAAAAGGPFRPHPSTCFIDPADLYGLGASVCRSCSRGWAFFISSIYLFYCPADALSRFDAHGSQPVLH